MDALYASQTIFYIVASVAILALGAFLCVAAYYLVRILKNTKDVSDDVEQSYRKIKRSAKKIISLISNKKNGEDKK